MNSGEFPPQQSLLRDVDRIYGRVAIPASRDILELLVEEPLLAACQEFYDKNIRTIGSSANVIDVSRGYAYINIDCNTLSAQNRTIADNLGMQTFKPVEADGTELEVGSFLLAVSDETTAQELSHTALELARQFELQPMLWAPVYEIDLLKKQYPELEEEILIARLTEDGYYIDPVEQKIYLSQEHYHKAKGLPVE